jgi:hypothetical protein
MTPLAKHGERVLPFATTNHRSQQGRRFGIKAPDLLRHVWILGKTGMGKSTLIETLFLAEARSGSGAGLIDPHGDLATRIVEGLPRTRRGDLRLVDPSVEGTRPSLNLVGFVPPVDRALAASVALSVLRKTFADAWGPRTEHILRCALLTLLDVPRSTLAGVPKLLLDERFRAMALRHVRDDELRRFWEEEFETMPASFRSEVLAAPLNKIGALLLNPTIRAHIDQPRRMLDLGSLMDDGKLLVANLGKGKIGEDASGFLGSILLGAFQLAGYRRASQPPDQRRPFTLYIDEFPSFVTPSFAELLAEARKYGLGLVLANQHLAQVDDRLRGALLGNAGTFIVFRISAEDALALEPEFAPELGAHDLARLGRYEIAIKLAVDGVTSAPFTARTNESGRGAPSETDDAS